MELTVAYLVAYLSSYRSVRFGGWLAFGCPLGLGLLRVATCRLAFGNDVRKGA
jgi:hypothetical protein